jgi:hypothetical protein
MRGGRDGPQDTFCGARLGAECLVFLFENRVHHGVAQLALTSWAGSSAWIGYMTWIKALMCRSARASGFCGPGGLGCCSEASKYCRGCDLIPPFDFDSDSDATLGSGWFVQTVGHRRTEPGEAIAPASYVNDSGRDRHRHCAGSACAQKCGAAGHSDSEWAKLDTA